MINFVESPGSVHAVDDRRHVPIADCLHGSKLGTVASLPQLSRLAQQAVFDHLVTAMIDPLDQRVALAVQRQVKRPVVLRLG